MKGVLLKIANKTWGPNVLDTLMTNDENMFSKYMPFTYGYWYHHQKKVGP